MKEHIRVIVEDYTEIDFWYSDVRTALLKFKSFHREVEATTGVRHSHVDPYIGVLEQLHDNIRQRCMETPGSVYGLKFLAEASAKAAENEALQNSQ